ncbi:MAG: lysylphosphatidylglycerol synthase domain-containing protein [Rubrivivax sp.]
MKTLLRRLLKVAPWLLAAAVLWLVGREASAMDWAAVGDALKSIPVPSLLLAAALAAASHLLVSSFDLIGRQQTRHGLSVPRTLLTAAISYAFNLNFGALVGGMAMRLRLYTRQGLQAATVAQVIGLSMLTNWLGYALLAGVVLLANPPPLPASWPLGERGLRIAGAVLLSIGIGYVLVCSLLRRREWCFRGQRLQLPRARMALWQAAVSSSNWLLMSTIVWGLLQGQVAFNHVTAALLLAAVAGVIAHVPAGLGVLEAVFVATLAGQVPPAQLLAALLAYRAVYYLMPLLWAVPAYALAEAAGRAGQADADAGSSLNAGSSATAPAATCWRRGSP